MLKKGSCKRPLFNKSNISPGLYDQVVHIFSFFIDQSFLQIMLPNDFIIYYCFVKVTIFISCKRYALFSRYSTFLSLCIASTGKFVTSWRVLAYKGGCTFFYIFIFNNGTYSFCKRERYINLCDFLLIRQDNSNKAVPICVKQRDNL